MAKTLVTFLLDRTGSMSKIKADTIGAFNTYLGSLRQGGDDIAFTFVQFDSVSVDKVCVKEPVSKVADLTNETFIPRAWTPLIDASYKTIEATEKAAEAGQRVVVCILTDGDENASKDHTWEQLNDLIKKKTALGWEFNFMGASIDAYKQAKLMGIAVQNTMSYDSSDRERTFTAFKERGATTRAYASGLVGSMAFSASAKTSAGDVFDPALKVKTAKQEAKPIVEAFDLRK